jgi:alpha-1,3-rhamnosyltransferase
MMAILELAETSPLVSIVAISYNQSEWVCETLDSIFEQDYKNIELIVSDDGSVDGTQSIVQGWLDLHKYRFSRVKLLASQSNQGICRNLIEGIEESRGIWVKPIACDDLLRKDAISKLIKQVQVDGAELAFSQITKFETEGANHRILGNLVSDQDVLLFEKSIDHIKRALRIRNFFPAPSVFYSRKLYNSVGGIDATFKHLDDWPLWLRMLSSVQKVSWVSEPLVLYRISEKSVTKKHGTPISTLLYEDVHLFYKVIQSPMLTPLERFDRGLLMLQEKLAFEYFGNSWFVYVMLTPIRGLSPYFIQKLGRKVLAYFLRMRT